MRHLTGSALILIAAGLPLLGATNEIPNTPAELFDGRKVWSVHLRFAADQWTAMEPAGGQNGFGGGRGGGFGRGGFGPGGGPGGILATAFLKGDTNGDQKLSQEELVALSDKWFSSWDSSHTGKLSEAQLGAGIESLMDFGPGRGGPGGGFGGRGGPGRGPGGGMLGANGRNGASAMAGIDFKYVHASLDFNGKAFADVAVRYKGNSTFMQSRGSLKRSLKLDLNKYVKGNRLAGVSTLNFHSEVTDAASLNEAIAYGLFRGAKVPAPRTSYARVYLTVPGKYENEYMGLYAVVEDIDSTFAKERFATKEGAIFKPSTGSLFGYLGDDWSKYNQMYDPKTDLTNAQKQRVIDFAKVVTNSSDSEFAARLPEFLDIDEFARYMAVNVWVANMDSILAMGQNFYLYLDPKTSRFSILPWDLDLAFGGMGGGAELSVAHPWRGTNKFLERLYADSRFQTAYRKSLTDLAGTVLRPETIAKQVEQTASLIRPAVAEEKGRLERFDASVAGQNTGGGGGFGGFGGGGRGPGGMPIKAFVTARAKSVGAQLAGESKGQTDDGFGPFGGRGGGPGGRGGIGGPMAAGLMKSLDTNSNGELTQAEMREGLVKMFRGWGGDKGPLNEEAIRDGAGRDLMPAPGAGFGPPGR